MRKIEVQIENSKLRLLEKFGYRGDFVDANWYDCCTRSMKKELQITTATGIARRVLFSSVMCLTLLCATSAHAAG